MTHRNDAGHTAKIIRTHPPASLAGAGLGVDALTFSGTYPLTRLAITDTDMLPASKQSDDNNDDDVTDGAAVTAEVFGYSTLKYENTAVNCISSNFFAEKERKKEKALKG